MIIANKIRASLVVVPEALINDEVISDKARVLYLRLAAKGESKNLNKGKIAEACGYSLDTYKKYEKELELRGWITVAEKKGKEQDRVTLNFEVEPVAAPKEPAKNAEFKPENTELKGYIDIYHKFYLKRVGVKPLIDGVAVNAIKQIAYYMSGTIQEGKTIEEAIQKIFDNWELIDPFYQDQLKPVQILYNLPNIINQVKNGVTKRKKERGHTGSDRPTYTDQLKNF